MQHLCQDTISMFSVSQGSAETLMR